MLMQGEQCTMKSEEGERMQSCPLSFEIFILHSRSTGLRLPCFAVFLQPGNNLLRHTEEMLTVASFRTWRGSHLSAAQGHSPAAGKPQRTPQKERRRGHNAHRPVRLCRLHQARVAGLRSLHPRDFPPAWGIHNSYFSTELR